MNIVDVRINNVTKELRREMEEERKFMVKHEKKLLIINVGIATTAIFAFVFNRLLG